MFVLISLCAVSAAVSTYALLVPAYADVLPVSTLAMLICLLLALLARLKSRRRKPARWVIVDGSNVMYWKTESPEIQSVRDVLDRLKRAGYTVGVMFDANAGHLLCGKYQHDSALGKKLGLPTDRVMVVPKGRPADPYILTAAREINAQIVTNDKFRDWTIDFPEVRDASRMIRGCFKGGRLNLDIPT